MCCVSPRAGYEHSTHRADALAAPDGKRRCILWPGQAASPLTSPKPLQRQESETAAKSSVVEAVSECLATGFKGDGSVRKDGEDGDGQSSLSIVVGVSRPPAGGTEAVHTLDCKRSQQKATPQSQSKHCAGEGDHELHLATDYKTRMQHQIIQFDVSDCLNCVYTYL